jgi:endonuclease/exonuclease/phosphatase family metal-dependent hydrolase
MAFFARGLFAQSATVDAAPPMAQLRVLTYNIRYENPGDGANVWPNRREAMARYLAEMKPDLFGLQEAERQQSEYLASALPDYRWYGVGRDDGKQAGEGTPIFYRPDRLEAIESKTFWLSEKPEEPGSKSWDAALTRICSWIKFRDKQTRTTFFAFNTHFDHRGRQARLESAKLIRATIARIAGDAPVVLLGDFNAQPQSEPYKALTTIEPDGPPALLDAREATQQPAAGPTGTWNGFTKIIDERRIDFIFVRGFEVAAYRVDDPRVERRFVSDHLPVVAELQFVGP